VPKLKIFLSLAIIFSLFAPAYAHAEYCDMIGGEGDISWIYIPRILTDMKSVKSDRSGRLFVEDRLPEVNETVTLNVDIASTQLPACLPNQSCSNEEIKRFEHIKEVDGRKPYIEENGIYKINESAYQCLKPGGRRGCWDLNEGARLKILSYTKIDDVLFALVLVESC